MIRRLLSLRVIVYELSQFLIYWVVPHWNVDSDTLFELHDVILEGLDLNLRIFQLSQQLQ